MELPSSTEPSESQRSALALCWAVLARQHSQNQRISAGACTVTPRTRSWRICSFAFRAAPNTAQSAPHRFPRSEQRETVGRLRPRSDRIQGGAGSKHQVRHPFPPTFGFSGTGAKAGKSRGAKIIRVLPAPQLHRGAIRAELWRVIFAAGATEEP